MAELGHWVVPFLGFGENSILMSMVDGLIYMSSQEYHVRFPLLMSIFTHVIFFFRGLLAKELHKNHGSELACGEKTTRNIQTMY